MKVGNKLRKNICGLLAIFLVSGTTFVNAQNASMPIEDAAQYITADGYFANAQYQKTGNSIKLSADKTIERLGDVTECRVDGTSEIALHTEEGSTISWKPGINGWYTVKITYCPENCRSSYAVRSVLIDGEVPYSESSDINISCIYSDKNGISRDYYGNDIRSTQVLNPRIFTADLRDQGQYDNEPLRYNLTEQSVLSIYAISDPLTVISVELIPYRAMVTYDEYTEALEKTGIKKNTEDLMVVQAENSAYKSDPTLVPVSDNSSSAVPHSNYLVRLNTISGDNWKKVGQFIAWNVTVKTDGLYRITLKSKQNYREGLASYRRLYVNGEVPFAEANCIRFDSIPSWTNITLGNEQTGDWFVFLKAGVNELRLEVILGNMGSALKQVSSVISELNGIYREILSITGVSPDNYRDYKLDTLIPETLKKISEEKQKLIAIREELLNDTSKKGNDFSIFDTLIKQLEDFERDSDNIPTGFSYFKTNIGSLGTWLTSAMEQPLSLDQIVVGGDEQSIPKSKVGFFKSMCDAVSSFISSFVTDYDSIGNMSADSEKSVKVWMTSGRDQMQILKTMIQNSFVKETGIGVKLENVEAGSILKAVFAGNGPDVVIETAVSDPVNYALRNAVCDLNQFDGIDEVKQRFYSETLAPFTFDGKLYALPQTLDMTLMFYRSDILGELGLTLPETWDDVIEVASMLQKNNMTFGLPGSDIIRTYATFMYQNGGELYRNNGETCLLTQKNNADAFEIMVNFFKNYSLELQYDFVNRFRTGEIPIGISSISVYNNLKVSAPEIDGLWGISLLPGTESAAGTINRAGYMSATGNILLSASKDKENAFKFLKWWTDESTQSNFGTEIESILGSSSRYLTANKAAFKSLPWTQSELSVINEQADCSRAVPEVPGSYYLSRHLTNAFRAVVIRNDDIKDTLDSYNKDINEELKSKRTEFGLK